MREHAKFASPVRGKQGPAGPEKRCLRPGGAVFGLSGGRGPGRNKTENQKRAVRPGKHLEQGGALRYDRKGPGERKEERAIAKTIYGYIRVSCKDQNEDRQRIALGEVPVPEKNIYIDKRSGKDFDRPQYRKLLRRLRPNDLLYIKSIDRLGRNYREILEQWRLLTREKQVDIAVLDMPLLDTRRGKDLMGTFLADVVLQVLSFVAENERANIRQRQAEGIAAAKARGVRFGRPPRPLPENFTAVYLCWKTGQITGTAAAAACGMPLATFRYRAELYEKTLLL